MCRDKGRQSVHVHHIFLPESVTTQSNISRGHTGDIW